MPLVLQKIIDQSTTLAIWKIEESTSELLLGLANDYFEESHQQRIQQVNASHYLASRRILTTLFPKQRIHLWKNAFNKPHLIINETPYFVSITHSFDFAAIIISKTSEVAIDIEKIDPRIGRVKHKFLNNNEISFAGNETCINAQTLIWSAKETLYKLYGFKGLDFKANLNILPFTAINKGEMIGSIQKDSFLREVPISYFLWDQYYISYSTEQIHSI
jgi:4'-phosphopantetheinyl transferase